MALTKTQIDAEIERLKGSDAVKLAHKAQKIGREREQYLYHLRWAYKKGQELMSQGYTLDNVRARMFPESNEDYEEGYDDE